jgi:hypothetical protein
MALLSRERLRSELPLLAVLALPVVLLAPAMVPGKVLSSADLLLRSYLLADARPPGFQPANDLLGDPILQNIPWRRFVSSEVRAGRLPLWNPYAYAGSPLHGNSQSAIFDPLCLPYLLAGSNPSRATVWVALLRMWVAGLGAYLFARRLNCSAVAAALAGTAFGTGGFMLVWLSYVHASSAAWLPWALLAAEYVATSPSPRTTTALAAAITAAALGGQLEIALLAALTASFYIVVRHCQRNGARLRGLLRVALRLAAVAALTILLTAIQTVPFLTALREGSAVNTRRPAGPVALIPRVAWETMPLQVFPYLFGRPLRGEGEILGNVTNFCESNGRYMSLLGLVLAVLALPVLPRRAPGRALAAVVGVAWLYSSHLPPLSTLAQVLPGIDLLAARRADVIVLLGLAVLAALGLDALTIGQNRGSRVLPKVLAATLAGSALVAAVVAAWMRLGAPGHDAIARAAANAPLVGAWLGGKAQGEITADLVRLAPMYGAHFLLPWAGFAVASAIWLGGAFDRRVRRQHWLAALIVAADLLYFGWGFNPALPDSRAYPMTRQIRTVTSLAAGGRALCLDQWLGNPANLGTYYGWEGVLGYDVVGHRRLESLLASRGPFPAGPGCFPLLHYNRVDAPVLDLLGVRVVTSRDPLDAPNLRPIGRIGEGFLYANPTALPRAFEPREVQLVAGPDAADAAVERSDFRPGRTAIVEAPAGTPATAARGAVTAERVAPGGFVVRADLKAGGMIVVSEPYDAGWRAEEEGVSLPVYPCDLAVMAVRIGAGHHEVTLVYRPPGWSLALASSALGFMVAIVLLVVGRRPRRPS